MRANKNFLSKPLEALFLACWLGCYVSDVCLRCLLNTFVNQRNPCALVVMSLFILLTIFQNHYLGKLSFLFKLFYLSKISAKIYLWDKAFIKTKYLQNYPDLQSRMVPTILQTFILLLFIKGFQSPLRKSFSCSHFIKHLVCRLS
jgi:hypothetical protein